MIKLLLYIVCIILLFIIVTNWNNDDYLPPYDY